MTFTLDKYMPYTVGFDRFFDTLDIVSNTDVKGFPHYNIKKVNEGEWEIDFALAGFSKDNIDINVKENKMTVKGEIESDNEEYLYKGISTKKFFKTFSLAEYTEPTEATMENGVLKIKLKQELPEEKKPKTIKIK
jgi:molecular chaperone IbpA|tara:strand:- start:143 stop:547 length:405 start_codon:yes stop_codon:yes gene_type:complete